MSTPASHLFIVSGRWKRMQQEQLLRGCLHAHEDLLRLERRLHAWMEYLCHGDPEKPWVAPGGAVPEPVRGA